MTDKTEAVVQTLENGYTIVFKPDPIRTHHVFKPGDSPWSYHDTVASSRAIGMCNNLSECLIAIEKHQNQVAELEQLKRTGTVIMEGHSRPDTETDLHRRIFVLRLALASVSLTLLMTSVILLLTTSGVIS